VVLTDVGDPEVAGLRVKAEGPRIAQAVGPDLGLRFGMNLREGELGDAEEVICCGRVMKGLSFGTL